MSPVVNYFRGRRQDRSRWRRWARFSRTKLTRKRVGGAVEAQHVVHPGRRSRIRRSVLLWAARFHHAQHRPHRRRWHAIQAGLRQFRGMHRLARGTDYRTLSIQVDSRSGRAPDRPRGADCGVAARTLDVAVDPEEGRLPVDPDRQMAFGQTARFRSAAEATIIFTASAGARSTTTRINSGRRRATPRICGMTMRRSGNPGI